MKLTVIPIIPREIEILDSGSPYCGWGCSGHFSESIHLCDYFDVFLERQPDGSPGPYKRCDACVSAEANAKSAATP